MKRSTHLGIVAPAGLLAVAFAACGGLDTSIPPGYTPLEELNVAAFPAAEGADLHPEKITFVNGKRSAMGETPAYDWAHGSGYIKAPLLAVWKALKEPDVVADRRQLTKWAVESRDADESAHASFQMRFDTNSKPSVTYVQGWRQRAIAGTLDLPTKVIVRDDLVTPAEIFGIILMQRLSDSVVIEQIDAGTTSFSGIRHRASLQGSPEDAQQYQADLYDSVVAQVHGRALPTY